MKALEDVLKQVHSPFTDDFIKALITMYVRKGCEFQKIYNCINHVEFKPNDEYIQILEGMILRKGTSIYGRGLIQDTEGINIMHERGPVYDYRENWMVVMSNPGSFAECERGDTNGNNLLYRIYLNLKGKEKADFIMEYIEACQQGNLDYKFKFSTKGNRDDEIVIQSKPEHFVENLSIVQRLTKTMQVGEPPMLVGTYGNNIGVAEEYYNRLISPTQKYIHLVGAAQIKFLCNHRELALQLCSEDEKEILNAIEHSISLKKKFAERRMKRGRTKSKAGEKISEMARLNENIYDSCDMYVEGSFYVGLLAGVIQKMYEISPDDYLAEMAANVRYIANNAFGISKDMIFSVSTEQNLDASKKKLEMVDID